MLNEYLPSRVCSFLMQWGIWLLDSVYQESCLEHHVIWSKLEISLWFAFEWLWIQFLKSPSVEWSLYAALLLYSSTPEAEVIESSLWLWNLCLEMKLLPMCRSFRSFRDFFDAIWIKAGDEITRWLEFNLLICPEQTSYSFLALLILTNFQSPWFTNALREQFIINILEFGKT